MALSGEAIKGIVEYALNNTPVDPALGGTMAIANRSGRVMTGMRDWFYLRDIATLDLIAGEDEVALPPDFAKLDAQEGSQTIIGSVSLVTDKVLLSLRENTSSNGGSTYQAALFSKQNPTSNGGPPSWVLKLDRPVASTQIAGFSVIYRRTWQSITADTSELRIPEYMDELYLQVLQAYAQDWTFQGSDKKGYVSIDQRLEQIRRGVVYMSAVRDDQPQQEFGALDGGHVGVGTFYRDWGSETIVDGI